MPNAALMKLHLKPVASIGRDLGAKMEQLAQIGLAAIGLIVVIWAAFTALIYSVAFLDWFKDTAAAGVVVVLALAGAALGGVYALIDQFGAADLVVFAGVSLTIVAAGFACEKLYRLASLRWQQRQR
jgi:tellurite resistance protein TehA-like permease